jgi:hypothetical protein
MVCETFDTGSAAGPQACLSHADELDRAVAICAYPVSGDANSLCVSSRSKGQFLTRENRSQTVETL